MGEPTLTDEFVEAFATDEQCTGAMARIVAMGGCLPFGVDEDDPRVIAVVERCRRMREACDERSRQADV